MRNALAVALVVGCGGGMRPEPMPDIDAAQTDASNAIDAYLGDLLGHSCPPPGTAGVERCSTGPVDDLAYCVDGGVCRPSCNYKGTDVSRCEALHGTEYVFRGVCVCVP